MSKRIFSLLSLSLLTLAVSEGAYATGPGLYLGLMMGPARNNALVRQAQLEGVPATVPVYPKNSQFGARLLMGYQFGRYAAVEGGFNYLSNLRYDTKGFVTCSDPSIRLRSFDLSGKGIFPIGESFNVFGRLGVGMTYLSTTGSLNPNLAGTCGASTRDRAFKPIFGVGAGYDITSNWVADLSLTRFAFGGAVRNITMVGVGISYHFTDRYCGQFLCTD